jgi:hypothetical protein
VETLQEIFVLIDTLDHKIEQCVVAMSLSPWLKKMTWSFYTKVNTTKMNKLPLIRSEGDFSHCRTFFKCCSMISITSSHRIDSANKKRKKFLWRTNFIWSQVAQPKDTWIVISCDPFQNITP